MPGVVRDPCTAGDRAWFLIVRCRIFRSSGDGQADTGSRRQTTIIRYPVMGSTGLYTPATGGKDGMSMIIDVTGLFVSLMALGVLLLIGQAIRSSVGILRALFLPTSIIAGFIGLLIGPQALGALITRVAGPDALFAGGLLPPPLLDVWSELPVLLINVVFAALFLGKAIPGIREIWSVAGPVITYGQTVAWGQYVVGLLLALLILTPVFGLPPEAGALIEIGFEGGHGTAAGSPGRLRPWGLPRPPTLPSGLPRSGW